jgi:phosphoribosylformylglycinamidine (FGAM) synthase-like enzyme
MNAGKPIEAATVTWHERCRIAREDPAKSAAVRVAYIAAFAGEPVAGDPDDAWMSAQDERWYSMNQLDRTLAVAELAKVKR